MFSVYVHREKNGVYPMVARGARFDLHGASGYVGRVGALALALGIGAAAVAMPAVAFADNAGSSGASNSVDSNSAGPNRGPVRGRQAATAPSRDSSQGAAATEPVTPSEEVAPAADPSTATPGRGRHSPADISAQIEADLPATTPTPEHRGQRAQDAPAPVPVPDNGNSTVAHSQTHAVGAPESAAQAPIVEVPAPAAAVLPAASIEGARIAAGSAGQDHASLGASGELSAGRSAAVHADAGVAAASAPVMTATPTGSVSAIPASATGPSDSADSGPMAPIDSPLAWGVLAVARRDALAASSTSDTPVGLASASAATTSGLVVAPTVGLVDGVIQGTLNATSSRGLTLKYVYVGTSDGGKLDLGSVPAGPTAKDPQSYTILPYATWLDAGGTKGAQTFNVRVSEVTPFDTFVVNVPLVGMLAAPVIDLLQQSPFIGDLLAPLIGASVLATINVDVAALAPGATPLAYTYKVASFDGTLISTNYFPAARIKAGQIAPTVLFGPGLGGAGATDPYGRTASADFVPGVDAMRADNYNVVTWDPRGEYASGGILQLDNPFYEGRDTSALISWVADNPLSALNGPGDPKVGMVGGSYGGGIQLVTAPTDPRVDAIVPGIAWNSLVESLYPNEIFKTAWGNFLLLALQVLPRVEGSTGSRINPLIYQAILTGDLFGRVSDTVLAMVSSSGPTTLLNKLTAPTLLVQGTYDSLFPLQQAVVNAQTILANPYDTPVKMIWFCGGHGVCGDKAPPAPNPDQEAQINRDTLAWLDQYVAGVPGKAADAIPNFQWYDQQNRYYSSEKFSFDPGFNNPTPRSFTGGGGTLGIVPLLGGSGSSGAPEAFRGTPLAALYRFPFDAFLGITATPANNALSVPVALTPGDQVVGAPHLSFSYSGLGTSRAVFAQIVEAPSKDYPDGRVIGSIVTAVPVTLDGKSHTVSIPLQQIAYTQYANSPALSLQITSSATQFANSSFGVVNIANVRLDLPTRATDNQK